MYVCMYWYVYICIYLMYMYVCMHVYVYMYVSTNVYCVNRWADERGWLWPRHWHTGPACRRWSSTRHPRWIGIGPDPWCAPPRSPSQTYRVGCTGLLEDTRYTCTKNIHTCIHKLKVMHTSYIRILQVLNACIHTYIQYVHTYIKYKHTYIHT